MADYAGHGKQAFYAWLGGLLWWLTTIGAGAVSSYYTAHSASLNGLPAYKAIPIGCATFVIVALGFYLLALAKAKWFGTPKASGKVECPEKWLHDIAKEQAKAIHNYVSIDCQITNHKLTGEDNLYIHFLFSVDSRCVFKLSLDDDISGSSISFASTRLKHAPVLSDNRVKGLAITHHAKCFEIDQPLTGAEAARLLTEQGSFNFYGVKTSLSCEPDWIGEPVHLELTCSPSLSQEFINSNYRKAFIEITPLPLRTFFRYRKATGGNYDLPTEPLGTVLTMRVKMTPHRSLKLRSFKLFTSGPIVSAETGEIRETPHIAADGQLVKTGTDYKPNLADLPTVEIDREDTIEGWLKFIVKGVEPVRMLDPSTFVVRLHAIDESTEEHWQRVTNLEWVARH